MSARAPHWTEAEEAIIRRFYASRGARYCLERLPGRTLSGVRARAYKLGAHLPSRSRNTVRLEEVVLESGLSKRAVWEAAKDAGVISRPRPGVAVVPKAWAAAYIARSQQRLEAERAHAHWLDSARFAALLGLRNRRSLNDLVRQQDPAPGSLAARVQAVPRLQGRLGRLLFEPEAARRVADWHARRFAPRPPAGWIPLKSLPTERDQERVRRRAHRAGRLALVRRGGRVMGYVPPELASDARPGPDAGGRP
ncbi:hypothetical protein [Calidithermus chliarophilus]|uniref:hypothetical protein n=1 Tax=Calidithermus chliarophilus TaxID=52023 RepID=UPI000424C06F|nr:hypothetical protein [Calidithermus chliarophilus]